MNFEIKIFIKPILLGIVLALAACTTPVSVRRVNPRAVHRMLTGNVLSNGELSVPTANALRRWDLYERSRQAPEAALAELHEIVACGSGAADEIFALAELSFSHAERTRQRPYYLAAAVYAYTFLFPEDETQLPDPYDPRQRLACDLYNRALTAGLAAPGGKEVELRAGAYALPFGELRIDFNPLGLRWLDRELVHFAPVAELEVRGMTNRYRRPGIGAPLAAGTIPTTATAGAGLNGFVSTDLKVAATAFLRLADPRRQLAQPRLRASLELFTSAEAVTVGGRRVPLEREPTAAYAAMLADPRVWRAEIGGFFRGDFSLEQPTRLTALHPYVPGRIPVVLVHGTTGSPGRWADMVNELENDPRLHGRIQIWLFTYDTGNPVAYSAMLLREALEKTVAALQRDGRDPALARMVLVGHSQGGLLIKLTAVDSGDRLWGAIGRKPLEALRLSPQTRELLARSYFVRPLPFVRRLIYLATPHQGSFVAAHTLVSWVSRFIKLPKEMLQVSGELVQGKIQDVFFTATHRMPTSVEDMTPGQPYNKALAALGVAPGVATHSIIAVQGGGPPEKGDDGVVKYSSAHVAGTASEKIVRAAHACQSCPAAIDEVRRILVEEVAQP